MGLNRTDLVRLCLTKRETQIHESLTHMRQMALDKGIDEEDVQRDLHTFIVVNVGKSSKDVLNFTKIPLSFISEYAVADAVITSRLYQQLLKELERKELMSVFRTFNKEGFLAFELEKNGICWDENKSAVMETSLEDSLFQNFSEYLELETVRGVLGIDDREARKLIAASEWKEVKDRLLVMSVSLQARQVMTRIVYTPTVKCCMLLHGLWDIGKTGLSKIAGSRMWVERIFELKKQMEPLSTVERVALIRSSCDKMLETFKGVYSQTGRTSREREVIQACLSDIPSMAADFFDRLFDVQVQLFGIDIEDESTYADIEEFRALVIFKRIKKILKALTTYLRGSVGGSRFTASMGPEATVSIRDTIAVTGWRIRSTF